MARGCFALAVVMAALLIPRALLAQPATTSPSTAKFPQLPPTRSPVDFFRELLAQDPVERLRSLTNRPSESQKLILAKLREYELLSAEQRELRLRVTELHYFLVPLMSTPATNRAAQLVLIPADVRKLVEDRLGQWDTLSPESQRELLQNEATLGTLNSLATHPPAQQKEFVTTLSPTQKADLEAGIRRWQALSDEQRRVTITRFNQFFDLTPQEKDKALATVSEAERQQIDRTLVTFEKLSPGQRAKCVRSFDKFASLSPDERQQFLKSAERWSVMSPSQRQLWRDLVYTLSRQPPMPQGTDLPPLPSRKTPPMPSTSSNRVAATN